MSIKQVKEKLSEAEIKNELLLAFLSPLDEYDREDLYEERFGHLNANDSKVFRKIVEEQYFCDSWYPKIPIDTKRKMTSALIEALQDAKFDFRKSLEETRHPFGLPSSWKIKRHRMLFEEIYRLLSKYWRAELETVGFSLPDLGELQVPKD